MLADNKAALTDFNEYHQQKFWTDSTVYSDAQECIDNLDCYIQHEGDG